MPGLSGPDLQRELARRRHEIPIVFGLDPARGDYASFANFSDPDGNSWVLQERGYRNV